MKTLVKMLNNITNVIAIPDYENDAIHLYDCENSHYKEIENILFDKVCYELTRVNDKGENLFEYWCYKGVEVYWYQKAGKKLFEKILVDLYKSFSIADFYDVLVHVEQPKRSKEVFINSTCKAYHLDKEKFFLIFDECIKLQSNTKKEGTKEYALKLRIPDKVVYLIFADSFLNCIMNEPLEKWLSFAKNAQSKNFLTNNGQVFEFLQTTLYGITPYKLDNVPFWVDGDYTTKDGKKVQCKAPKATLATIETLKKLIDTIK